MATDGTAGSLVRQPRSLIKLNGTAVPVLSWSSDENSFYQADTFRASIALASLPADMGLAWIGSQAKIEVEIFVGFPPDPINYTATDLKSAFFGKADDIDLNIVGRSVTLTGRDLTGVLIDAKSSEKYPNRTSSQIAEAIAAKHGLTPVVTATTTKVGRFYSTNQVRLQNEDTEWDLLTWLAREEHFAAYVKGHELHFEPLPDPNTAPYPLDWTPSVDGGPFAFTGTHISLSRSLTLAKDIRVVVRSWNHKQKRAFKATATRAKKGRGEVQEYSYTYPGLTADQAQKRAEKIADELTQHEMKLSFDGPADNVLSKASVIKLSGTGSPWDQVYYPSSINRSFDLSGGYAWHVEAKNHSVESEPTV